MSTSPVSVAGALKLNHVNEPPLTELPTHTLPSLPRKAARTVCRSVGNPPDVFVAPHDTTLTLDDGFTPLGLLTLVQPDQAWPKSFVFLTMLVPCTPNTWTLPEPHVTASGDWVKFAVEFNFSQVTLIPAFSDVA